MADSESLFSFEVIVESVENIVVSSHTAAIAFRLLDYPTLVIRSKENRGATSSSSYKFNAGKSCLFKINKDKLRTSLQNTPLYIMLVDIWGKNTKLLASTTISLSKCFDNVWQSIERNGLDVPVVLGNKGVFELYNLMGTPVAMVRLDYRIFSLGGTINGHVNICEPLVKSPCQPENTRRKEKDFSRSNYKTSTTDESLLTQNSSQKIENHLSIVHVESQTDFCNKEQSSMKSNKQSRPPKSTIGKGHVNIARPPPLYYNSQSCFMDSFSPVNSKSLDLTPEKRSVEKRDNTGNIEEAKPKDYYRTVSVQTTNEAEVPDFASKVHPEKAQHSNLPLVNALLNELSLVKQNWMNTATQLEQCPNGNKPQTVVVNSQELHVQTSQPDMKPLRCGVIKKCHLSPKGKIKKFATVKPSHKGVLVRRNPMKFKKSLLTCGTTKTQKLREAFNRKSAGCSNVSTDAKGRRRPETNERGGNLVASKNIETKEVACQVQITNIHKNKQDITQLLKEKKTNGNNTQLQHNGQDLVVRDVGIQVISPDDNLFPTQQDEDEDNRNLFDNPLQVGDSNDIHVDPNKMSDLKSQKYQEDMFHGSEVELSIHSTSCTAEELVSDKQLAFSNFPPPTRKNSRYSNDKHSNEEDKSSSIDIGLSKKNGLHGSKSHSHSKSLSNSSSEHNYSQDNFDSFTSDQVAESIASDNLNTGMSPIGTTTEQSDEK